MTKDASSPFRPGKRGPKQAGEPMLALRTVQQDGRHAEPVFVVTGRVRSSTGESVRVRRSLGLRAVKGGKEELLAQRLRALYEAQAIRDPDAFLREMGVESSGLVVSWRELLRAYTDGMGAASGGTMSIVRRLWTAFPPETPVTRIDARAMELAIKRVLGGPVKDSTLRRMVTQAQAILNFAVEQGWAKPVKLDKPSEGVGRQRWLDAQELEELTARLNQPFADLVTLLAYTGARVGEMEKLEWSSVGENGIVLSSIKGTNRTQKIERSRLVPLHPKVREVLLRRPTRTGRVWPEFGKAMMGPRLNEELRKAGAEDVTAHVLRHTFISRLMKDGAHLAAAKELAGHASVRTTERYTHFAPSHLEGIVKRLT